MTDDLDTFRHTTRTYINANSMELEGLKGDIERNLEKPWTEEFKKGLKRAIEEGTLSTDEFEQLTDIEFETDEEVKEWFKSVWAYLYEDGPEPE